MVEDAAREAGATFIRAPVGEANVARTIAESGATIGGEGNGGVILPSLHIGRDAPVGVALILHLLARTGKRVSEIVGAAPRYTIVKAKAPRGNDLGPVYRNLTANVSGGAGRHQGRIAAFLARIAGCMSGLLAPNRSSG